MGVIVIGWAYTGLSIMGLPAYFSEDWRLGYLNFEEKKCKECRTVTQITVKIEDHSTLTAQLFKSEDSLYVTTEIKQTKGQISVYTRIIHSQIEYPSDIDFISQFESQESLGQQPV